MEALSLFMFAVTLALGLTFLASPLYREKANISYFSTPTKSTFNIAWGFLFFMFYGFLITKNGVLAYLFITIIGINIFYLIYLYSLNNFIEKGHSIFSFFIKKIINFKIEKQKKLDESLNEKYSTTKALKILGVINYQLKLENAESIINQKYNFLKTLIDNKKINNTYLLTMLKNSYDTLVK